ncbi:BnaC04g54980D [Brassica napus]|uniref:(rape) hypothetical protein n=1 Tax=Brassica napus TaxID=3708 RepID=A0A078J3N5_BRANA|nr:unnamed protein product [Brassica napus]CDY58372.1 BnaC04g54980D [Brassica napus]
MIQVTLLVPNLEDSGDDLWFLGIGNILRYIWAAVSLYLDIINLFLLCLELYRVRRL